jgi:sulfonate transport system substrate-binding protein
MQTSIPSNNPLPLRLLGLLAAVAVVFALAACGGSEGSDGSGSEATAATETTTAASTAPADVDLSGVTLRVGVQKDGIRSFLERSGELDDAPYDIEWSTFTAGPPLVEAAAADKIDVAWVGGAPPIFGAAANADFKVVQAFHEDDETENSILVPKGSDIKTVKDLAGKKVAVGKGTSAHGMFVNALERNGLSTDDLEVAFLLPPDGLAAFSSGAVDAWVVWDPFVTQAVQEEGAVEIASGAPDEHGVQFEIASSASLEDETKRAAIADWVYRLGKGFDWAVANPDEWGDAWAEESGLPASVTRQVARNKALKSGPVSDEIIGIQQDLADVFFEAGELPVEVNFEDIVDKDLYEEGQAIAQAQKAS